MFWHIISTKSNDCKYLSHTFSTAETNKLVKFGTYIKLFTYETKININVYIDTFHILEAWLL